MRAVMQVAVLGCSLKQLSYDARKATTDEHNAIGFLASLSHEFDDHGNTLLLTSSV